MDKKEETKEQANLLLEVLLDLEVDRALVVLPKL